MVLEQSGRERDAEPIYRDVLARRTRQLGEDCYDTVESIHNLGKLLIESEIHHSETEALLRQANDWNARNLDPASPDLSGAAENLARLQRKRGDYLKAEKIQRSLLEANLSSAIVDLLEQLTSFEPDNWAGVLMKSRRASFWKRF
jgi:hypothetical protein